MPARSHSRARRCRDPCAPDRQARIALWTFQNVELFGSMTVPRARFGRHARRGPGARGAITPARRLPNAARQSCPSGRRSGSSSPRALASGPRLLLLSTRAGRRAEPRGGRRARLSLIRLPAGQPRAHDPSSSRAPHGRRLRHGDRRPCARARLAGLIASGNARPRCGATRAAVAEAWERWDAGSAAAARRRRGPLRAREALSTASR